jgi:hypothetical protein
MTGAANIMLDLFWVFAGQNPDTSHPAGIPDFDSGRVELEGVDGARTVIDGPDEYSTNEDGRWIVEHGPTDTQNTMDPGWLLNRFTDAVATSEQEGVEIVGELDRERAASTGTVGIADEWTPTYRATVVDGLVVAMAFELVGDDGEVGASCTFTLTPASVPPIELRVGAIDSRDYLAQRLGSSSP